MAIVTYKVRHKHQPDVMCSRYAYTVLYCKFDFMLTFVTVVIYVTTWKGVLQIGVHVTPYTVCVEKYATNVSQEYMV